MAKRIGDLLQEANIVTDEMLNYALRIQKSGSGMLGDILLQLKFVTDAEIAQVLAQQAGRGYIPLDGFVPAKNAMDAIPYKVAQRLEVLPLEFDNHVLRLAIADPFDQKLATHLSRYVSGATEYVVAPKANLLRCIELYYYLLENPIREEMESISNMVQKGQNFRAERLVELIIRTAIDNGSSDIHISATSFATLVSYRIDGVLQLGYSLPPQVHARIISVVKVDGNMDVAEQHRPQDGRMTFSFLHESYDLRLSTVPTVSGENLVIRLLANNSQLRSLEELGYNERQMDSVSKMVAAPYGMIIVVGPTGSGKSTSLYAMLRKINLIQKNVMTIEDPVEYQFPLIRQVAVNEKAGISFGSAIRGFLRQDPDVILVGEVRDEETAQLAIRAAQTGHLVLSTVHANDATSAIARLRDLGITDFILASSLSGIVAQRLVRRLCTHCRVKDTVSDPEQKQLGLKSPQVYKHVGCEHCNDTGYSGRVAVGEILELDEGIRTLIDSGASPLAIRKHAVIAGMLTLKDTGLDLILKGETDVSEFLRIIQTDADAVESRES